LIKAACDHFRFCKYVKMASIAVICCVSAILSCGWKSLEVPEKIRIEEKVTAADVGEKGASHAFPNQIFPTVLQTWKGKLHE